MKKSSRIVLEIGEKLYVVGKIMLYGLIGFGLLILELLICCMGWGADDIIFVLAVKSYEFVNFLTIISYIAIFVGTIGIPIFFLGLHYMGIGQIAVNTDKEELQEQTAKEIEKPEIEEVVLCKKCGNQIFNDEDKCSNCGETR